jgi:hypothetical protein
MSYPLGNKVYEFGLTETGNCYIKFPEDIATLAPDGFYIRYMVSNGKNGNIKANTLTNFLTDIVDAESKSILNDFIQIIQPYSITNGSDPETLNSAYNNYKKTIGTFNTLITRRDFENFILRLNEVANCVVSDRTCDINNTNYIQKWTPDYNVKELISRNIRKVDTEGNIIEDSYNPIFTMYLYLVNYIENINKDNYNLSYKPDTNSVILDTIISELDSVKAAQYDIKTHIATSIFNFNNIYTMRGNIYPKFKVTRAEKKDIENNIKLALIDNFNPKTLNYGQELDYQDVINVIKNSDTRINNVLLNNFGYNTYVRDFNNVRKLLTTVESTDTSPFTLDNLVARMILSGNVQLYKFDDNFNFEFGQTERNITSSINSITTIADIKLSSSDYEIKPNELIELYTENYITIAEYGVNVSATLLNGDTINAYEIYQLENDAQIKVEYIDAISGQKTETFLKNVIIETNRDLFNEEKITLNTSDYIKVKQKNTFTINRGLKYVAFFNSKDDKTIEGDYILQENEYLIYVNNTSTGLVILSMGTKLSSSSITLNNKRGNINLDDLNNENIESIDWDELKSDLIATEMLITTLGEGIIIQSDREEIITLSNDLHDLSTDINSYPVKLTYRGTASGSFADSALQKYKIRSRLNLNSTILSPQELFEGQKITLNTDSKSSNISGSVKEGKYVSKFIQFNHNVILTGGVNIDGQIITLDEDNLNISTSLECYSYSLSDDEVKRAQGNITYKGETVNTLSPVPLPEFDVENNSLYLLPIQINILSDLEKAKIEISGATIYSDYRDNEGNRISSKKGNIYKINDKNLSLTFTDTTSADTVQIGKIIKVKTDSNGNLIYNSDEINYKDLNQDYNVSQRISNILSKMRDVDINNEFNWIYKVLEEDKVLQPTSPAAFWNPNHIGNLYTISKLDIDNSSLTINQNYIV